MQNHTTQHVISDNLKNRYPYRDDKYTSDVDPTQVTSSFGDRAIPKLTNVIKQHNLGLFLRHSLWILNIILMEFTIEL